MDKGTLCELLECSVCMESFNECNNKVLPCQHTFCRFCLDAIVAAENRLVCPECRLSVDTKVDDLPSNVLLNRILSTLKNPMSQDVKKQRERRRKKGLSSLVDYGMKELSVPCAKALYSYKALENGDLSFRKGDLVELLYKVDENWFVGRLHGNQGFMPSNYIQVLCPLSSMVTTCRARHNFSFRDVDWRNDCLSFKKNDLITVIGKVDENWLEGSFHNKVGIFPEAFVELSDTNRLLLQTKLAPSPTDHLTHNQSEFERYPKTSASMRLTNENPVMASSCDFIDSNESITPSQSTSNSYPNLSNASKSPAIRSSETESTDDGTEETNKVHPIFDGDGTLPLYQALLNYFPNSPEELNLEVGKMYVALKDKGGGWLLGKSVAKGTVGLFPSSLVKFLRNWNYIEKEFQVHLQESKKSFEPTKNASSNYFLPILVKHSNSCDDLSTFSHTRDVLVSKQMTSQDKTSKRRSANIESLLSENTELNQDLKFCSSHHENISSWRNVMPVSFNQIMNCQHEKNQAFGDARSGEMSQTPLRGHLRLSSIAYGVSSLIHRNMVKQKMMNKRCMSASASRCQ